jgi:hypothetical protein
MPVPACLAPSIAATPKRTQARVKHYRFYHFIVLTIPIPKPLPALRRHRLVEHLDDL